MRFGQQYCLHSALFEQPSVVDSWLDSYEMEFVKEVWLQGWLPRDITWDFWSQQLYLGGATMPCVRLSMDVTERRRR